MELFKDCLSEQSIENKELLDIKEASIWASNYLRRKITTSNISYLVQYGKVKKHGDNGNVLISKSELLEYYQSYYDKKISNWKKKLGDDLNWRLSFEELREVDTTKHVHRLHPYKGKFIPQLVEYFLDDHVDEFKDKVYFKKGDIVLDPFCGSGTTLVQANELGINAVGIDISEFNVMLSNCKITKYDLITLHSTINKISSALEKYVAQTNVIDFEYELLEELSVFNNKHFPSPEYKYRLNNNEIDEKDYSIEKGELFLPIYNKLAKKYDISTQIVESADFLENWLFPQIRNEVALINEKIEAIDNKLYRDILRIMLSRTVRSCRATTHFDLTTLKKPVSSTYYCVKHKKICKPIFSLIKWWRRYTKDTIARLSAFDRVRTDTFQMCINGDSRTIDIFEEVHKGNIKFGTFLRKAKMKGIFTSPPYVGLIDYHEQHSYAYEIFNIERQDDLEIGPMHKGSSINAKKDYVEGIASVLKNSKKYLSKDFDIFVVANDKFNLYPDISKRAGLKIVNKFKRPVLNRSERDKGAYSEIIFHLKEA